MGIAVEGDGEERCAFCLLVRKLGVACGCSVRAWGGCALRPSVPGEGCTQRKSGWSRRRSPTPGSVVRSETHKVWDGEMCWWGSPSAHWGRFRRDRLSRRSAGCSVTGEDLPRELQCSPCTGECSLKRGARAVLGRRDTTRRRAGCSMTLGERVPVSWNTDGPKEGAVVPSIAGEASVKSGGTPLLRASVWRRSETCSTRRERVLVGRWR
ncbi:hypothetical protein B0H14DRAFT_79081 [Mycena olivaceomarginata]|nr:hypothetical protein B0H14DRAFT_79081 [Mycena olivaceomarginata]